MILPTAATIFDPNFLSQSDLGWFVALILDQQRKLPASAEGFKVHLWTVFAREDGCPLCYLDQKGKRRYLTPDLTGVASCLLGQHVVPAVTKRITRPSIRFAQLVVEFQAPHWLIRLPIPADRAIERLGGFWNG